MSAEGGPGSESRFDPEEMEREILELRSTIKDLVFDLIKAKLEGARPIEPEASGGRETDRLVN